jgi:hypothetical protein
MGCADYASAVLIMRMHAVVACLCETHVALEMSGCL